MVKDEAFLDLEKSLSAELEPAWLAISRRFVSVASVAIKEGDLNKVVELVNDLNVEALYKGKHKKINFIMKTGLLFGGSRVSGGAINLFIQGNEEVMGVAGLAQTQFEVILDQSFVGVKRTLVDTAVKIKERLDFERQVPSNIQTKKVEVKKINPINVPSVLGKATKSAGSNMINIASSLQMSRLSGYGFASEANARGITTYRVNEVLDSRTCPVCRRMHGKEFKVQDALRKLDALIRVTDPSDLRLLAPFPKQDAESLKELDKLTTEQLRAKGLDTPPYHPRCRGLLAVSLKGKKLQTVRTLVNVSDSSTSKPINPRVAEFLDSIAAESLTIEQREAVIFAAVGVTNFQDLSADIISLIEDLQGF